MKTIYFYHQKLLTDGQASFLGLQRTHSNKLKGEQANRKMGIKYHAPYSTKIQMANKYMRDAYNKQQSNEIPIKWGRGVGGSWMVLTPHEGLGE